MKVHGKPGDLVFMGPLEVFQGKLSGELMTKTKADDPYGQYMACHPWSDRLPELATALAQSPNAIILTDEERDRIMGIVDALIAAELLIDGSPAATAERDLLFRELRTALGFDDREKEEG